MAARVAINGFGRIGRNTLRAALGNAEMEFVAVNDLTDSRTLAHLLKYASVRGMIPAEIGSGEGFISVDGKKIKVLSGTDPEKLPWKDLAIDVVLEGTGRFTSRDKAAGPPNAGAAEGGSPPPPRALHGRKGKLAGMAVRVPVPTVSLVALVAELERPATAEEINAAFKEASTGRLSGILDYCDEPCVSIDFKVNPHSSIIDALSTKG